MSYQRIRDGFMFIGHISPSFDLNLRGGTFSSAFLIINEGKGCLIDASITAGPAEEICTMIKDSGCELKYIILTHDHYDHVANVGLIKARFGGKIVAHKAEAPIIENPLLLFSDDAKDYFPQWSLPDFLDGMNMSLETWGSYQQVIEKYQYFPQHVDICVEDGQVIDIGNMKLHVIHTPGHSPGSISILNSETNSLYVGDLNLFPKRPYPIGDVKASEESLLKIKHLKASFLGIGHEQTPTGTGEVRNFLLMTIEALYNDERRIIESLQSRHVLTVQEISDIVKLFPGWERHQEYPLMDFNIYCHLIRLEQEGIVTRTKKNGMTLWRLIN